MESEEDCDAAFLCLATGYWLLATGLRLMADDDDGEW